MSIKLTDQQKKVLQHLRTLYCVNYAEDSQDGTVFDNAILDSLSNENIDKLINKNSGIEKDMPIYKYTFPDNYVFVIEGKWYILYSPDEEEVTRSYVKKFLENNPRGKNISYREMAEIVYRFWVNNQ